MMRRAATAMLVMLALPAAAREPLGVHGAWGAFRDEAPWRCFAISEPRRAARGEPRPFASIAFWPERRIRGQLHIRLGAVRRVDAPVTLTIGARRWRLLAGRAEAWAANPAMDAAIVAAMRSARAMSVETVAENGRAFAHGYSLAGAATAIDAAALACARLARR